MKITWKTIKKKKMFRQNRPETKIYFYVEGS